MSRALSLAAFRDTVWRQGRELYRSMPWRDDTRPYYVLVSEMMLQQTQVERVVPKFEAFIAAFPTLSDLATASLAEVLVLWSGLGYNRRAKYLWLAAQAIQNQYQGSFPTTLNELTKLPGVGPNTAGALMAYAFNEPVVFIETNIRSVYFYHFFAEQSVVSDAELRELVTATIDRERPREWYWALMDYGNYLKRHGAGALDKSAHYKKQAPLQGSIREVRGMILALLTKGDLSEAALRAQVPVDDRFAPALEGLIADGLVARSGVTLHLAR